MKGTSEISRIDIEISAHGLGAWLIMPRVHGQCPMANAPWPMAQGSGLRTSGLRTWGPTTSVSTPVHSAGHGMGRRERLRSPLGPNGTSRGARELLPTAKGCLRASSSLTTASSRSVTQTALTCLQESPTLRRRLARDRTVATAKTSKTERISKQTDGLAHQGRATRHTSHVTPPRRAAHLHAPWSWYRGDIAALYPRSGREVAATCPGHGRVLRTRPALPEHPPISPLPALSPSRLAAPTCYSRPATRDLRPATCDLVLPFPHLAGLAHNRPPPPRRSLRKLARCLPRLA
jgi:hypothetical protein